MVCQFLLIQVSANLSLTHLAGHRDWVFTWLLKINYFTATLQPHTYFTTQPQGSPMSVHYDILSYSRSGIGDYSMDEGW